MTRPELINLFAPFVKQHHLTPEDLLNIMDCCNRELGAAGTNPRLTKTASCVFELMREDNRIPCLYGAK